jgi:hypothetical protein
MRRSMLYTLAGIATCFVSAALAAQQHPLLISTVALSPNDSALVRTAKLSVAARRGAIAVINDETIARSNGRGVVSFASGTLEPIHSASAPPALNNAPAGPASAPAPDRAKIVERQKALAEEHARMREEAEQPYGGVVEEDKVIQRLNQIPQEQQQLQPQPPPPM